MGKKNIQKRRAQEREAAIGNSKTRRTTNTSRSKNDDKSNSNRLSRHEMENLKEFGVADEAELLGLDEEGDESAGRVFRFDEKGELINEDVNENQEDNGEKVELLGTVTRFDKVMLGNKRNVIKSTEKNKGKSNLGMLLGLLPKSKRKIIKEKVEKDETIIEDNKIEDETQKQIEDEIIDELNEDLNSDVESLRSDELSEDDQPSSSDTYKLHFLNNSYKNLDELVKLTESKDRTAITIGDPDKLHIVANTLQELNEEDKSQLNKALNGTSVKFENLHVKSRVIKAIEKDKVEFNSLQNQMFRSLDSYRDIYYPLQTFKDREQIRLTYVIHSLNHVFKVRDRILKNNMKLAKARAENEGEAKETEEFRDSGFTRCKVLMVVPFRSVALDLMNKLCKYSGCEQVENKKRFIQEYSIPEGTDDPILKSKLPDDHKATFSGNTEDAFKVGIKVTRKSMKLYSPFYQSDIIIASPLGLRLLSEDKELDFLSSVEIVVIDQADCLLMQNWEHLTNLMSKLNKVPKESHGCDFARVKEAFLDGRSINFRQTVIFSNLVAPELNSLLNQLSNVRGLLRFRQPSEGVLSQIKVEAKHIFLRLAARTHTESDDIRFKYFVDTILPIIRRKNDSGISIVLFIPSYFDLARVRNYLKDHKYDFALVSEYVENKDLVRERNKFRNKSVKLMLYTERCHFYRRLKHVGANNLIFYAPPLHPTYYSELADQLALPQNSLEDRVEITTCLDRFDHLKLTSILGGKLANAVCFGKSDRLVID